MTSRKLLAFPILLLGTAIGGTAAIAQGYESQPANYSRSSMQSLPIDRPVMVSGIETVCTGIDSDTRMDPRWTEYPLRLEFAAGGRSYVSNEQVQISGRDAQLSVHCAGPWVLAKLPPGRYRVSATVEGAGTKTANVSVGRGQSRVVLHFPEVPAGESNGSMGPNPPPPEPEYQPVIPPAPPH